MIKQIRKSKFTGYSKWLIGMIILAISLINLGCSNDNEDEVFEPDEYYVRYEGSARAIQFGSWQITIRDEDRTTSYEMNNNGSFEYTIGPVAEGFNSYLAVRKTNNVNGPVIKLQISISKNNGPFAIREVDDSSEFRDRAEISYTIK